MDEETAIGFDEILRILHWSKTKFYSRRQELLDAGVIFNQFEGRPPWWRVTICERHNFNQEVLQV